MNSSERLSTRHQLQLSIAILLVITVLEVINLMTGRVLNQWGNIPREVDALFGILTGPFLHGSLWHFISNIVPLAVFLFLMQHYGHRRFIASSLLIILSTGLLVWLFGRTAIHIGASGVLYGYFGFLLVAGFISRRPSQILVSLFVGVFYGGMIVGVLPSGPFISWESHLFGFVSGLIAAKILVSTSSSASSKHSV